MSEEALNPLAVDLEEFQRRYLDHWVEYMRPKWEQAANEWGAKWDVKMAELLKPKE